MTVLTELSSWAEATLGLGAEAQRRVVLSLAVVILATLIRRVVLRSVEQRIDDVRVRYQWRKRSTYIAVVVTALAVGRIWFEGSHDIATYLGLLSAGLAIALKDLVADLAAWIFIMWRKPFEVGDRIQVGDNAGDVIDIRIFQFTLLEIGGWVDADQSTGRVIHVPNWKVFSEPLANFTRGFAFIWNELPVLVTFESDWRAAKTILADIVNRHAEHLTTEAQRSVREASSRFMIFYATLTPKVWTRVEDSGVLLTMRYLCDPRRRRGSEEAIWEDVLDAFAARNDIDFAYPTQRFYDNRTEGKPGATTGNHQEVKPQTRTQRHKDTKA
jgi:small-conductance mechanosensitive channel